MGNSEVFKRIYTAVATSIAAAPILISNSILELKELRLFGEMYVSRAWGREYMR